MEGLMGLAEKVRKYKLNLSFVYSFFTFGSIFAGGLLLLIGIGLINNFTVVAPSLFAFAVAGVIVLYRVFAHTLRTVERPRLEGLAWPLSFLVPFVVVYTVAFAFDLPPVFLTSGAVWYLALGIAFTSVALLVERWYVASRLLFARPLLLTGLLIIPSTPFLILADSFAFPSAGNFVGMGLMLLIYFAAASLLLLRAEESFQRP